MIVLFGGGLIWVDLVAGNKGKKKRGVWLAVGGEKGEMKRVSPVTRERERQRREMVAGFFFWRVWRGEGSERLGVPGLRWLFRRMGVRGEEDGDDGVLGAVHRVFRQGTREGEGFR